MSFDIYSRCFRNGVSFDYPFALIEQGFGPYTEIREPGWWALKYPDGGRCELYVEDEDGVVHGGFMVARPPDSPAFWKANHDIMTETQGVLFWAGDGYVVPDASVIPHLPPSMIETLGIPTVTTDVEVIFECIERA